MNNQKGVTLIITFMIMTIMLVIVLSISTVLFKQIKVINSIGGSVSSFYASESGAEQTLYFDKKQIPSGATRGFCDLCNHCDSNDCQNCTVMPLAQDGCNIDTCNNCQITYDAYFDDTTYSVNAKIIPQASNPNMSVFDINALGHYKDSTRAVNINLVK